MDAKKEKEIAQKLYLKIELFMRENNTNRHRIAEKMGHRKQSVSEIMLRLKDGKFPRISSLLKLQEALGTTLIFFDI